MIQRESKAREKKSSGIIWRSQEAAKMNVIPCGGIFFGHVQVNGFEGSKLLYI